MIEAVRRIGDYVLQDNSEGVDSTSTYIENPNSNRKYKYTLVIILKETGDGYSFDRVMLDEFQTPDLYLYKKGPSNGTDATPTSKIAGKIDKTFNRFVKWFENCNKYDLSEDDQKSLQKMKKAIIDQKDTIFEQLNEKYANRDSKYNAIITLGFSNDDSYYTISKKQMFKSVLIQTGKDKFYKNSKAESLGTNALCSICKQKKKEVYGFAIPWTFHTFDKPGFIAGGFDIHESWKDTPVCFDCATRLEVGKKYVEEHLDFGFYGFRYLLVPKLALGGDFQEIMQILEGTSHKKNLKLTKDIGNNVKDDEDEIRDLVKDQKDFISNSLIFYKKEQSSYRILLLIEGILPSRIRTLFDIKDEVDELFAHYNDIVLSEAWKEKNQLRYNFGVIRRFFPQESKNRTFDKTFLEIINKVFTGDPIDYFLLVSSIMKRVRETFIKGNTTRIDTLCGFWLLHYLTKLNILRNYNEVVQEMNDSGSETLDFDVFEGLPLDKKVENFFGANKAFFTSSAKKATFLEGVLAQDLLNIQWTDKNATPFRTKLHGLKMNESLIKRLLPEIQNKLEEYQKNYYRDLEAIIAQYFVSAGVNWKESDDELSFYFVLGMDMHKLFKHEKEEREDDMIASEVA